MTTMTVIATNPVELEQARDKLLAFFTNRLRIAQDNAKELADNLAIAKREGWKTSGLTSALSRARTACRYYEKIRRAVEAGYHIVPNMPVDVFAIRTDAAKPAGDSSYQSWASFKQHGGKLAAGEGRYVDSLPVVHVMHERKQDGTSKPLYFPAKFDDVAFPFAVAKPQILESMAEAMRLKIFDALGCLPNRAAKGDPMIIGVIRGPGYKECQFVVSWWIDPETI